MTVPSATGRPAPFSPWQWPVDADRYDTALLLRPTEQDAITELGPATCAAWPGTTPRQLDPPGTATILPIIDVRQAQAGSI